MKKLIELQGLDEEAVVRGFTPLYKNYIKRQFVLKKG